MTRDEVLSMKPGRELDALIAEKVMGYKIITNNGKDRPDEWAKEKYFIKLDLGIRLIPHYSTDIAAAWEVVERMTSLFWEMNLDTGSKSNTTKVEFYRTFDQEFHVVVANTAPEAICKAALLAVMGE